MESSDTKRFPLREAYDYAAERGIGTEATAIRDMEIEWDRSYTSTVRRGHLIRLFEQHGCLADFIGNRWRTGDTPRGQSELRQCLRIAREYDEFLGGEEPGNELPPDPEALGLQFALEAHLRDFLARNLNRLEPGLELAAIPGKPPMEYPIDGGRIDILAVDKDGKYVVVELKLSRGRNKTLGQLVYYMGSIDRDLGNGPCRGIIVAADISDDLRTAVSRVPGVTLARYRMSFAVERVSV
jgi:hypothetical protein